MGIYILILYHMESHLCTTANFAIWRIPHAHKSKIQELAHVASAKQSANAQMSVNGGFSTQMDTTPATTEFEGAKDCKF